MINIETFRLLMLLPLAYGIGLLACLIGALFMAREQAHMRKELAERDRLFWEVIGKLNQK